MGFPRTIAIGSLKGGQGKTTIAAHLAVRFGQGGFRVKVYDADTVNGSLADLARARIDNDRATVPLIFDEKSGKLLRQTVQADRPGWDFQIIDVGGSQDSSLFYACSVADALLVPITPDGLSTRTLLHLSEIVESVTEASNPSLRVFGMINRPPNPIHDGGRSQTIREAVAGLDGFEMLDSILSSREAYAHFADTALTVWELPDSSSTRAARADYMALIAEIGERCGQALDLSAEVPAAVPATISA